MNRREEPVFAHSKWHHSGLRWIQRLWLTLSATSELPVISQLILQRTQRPIHNSKSYPGWRRRSRQPSRQKLFSETWFIMEDRIYEPYERSHEKRDDSVGGAIPGANKRVWCLEYANIVENCDSDLQSEYGSREIQKPTDSIWYRHLRRVGTISPSPSKLSSTSTIQMWPTHFR